MKRILLAMLIVLGISFYANAQPNTWDGSSSNNWNTGANWSQGSVPDAADDVIININATISVNTATLTVNSLTVSGGAVVTLTSSGGARTITIDNSGSSIASGSSLTLNGTGGLMSIAYTGSNQTMSIAGTLILANAGSGSAYTATNSLTTVTGIIRKGAGGGGTSGAITSTAANLTFGSGGRYDHAIDAASAVPTATWNANSTCAISNWSNSANTPTGLTGQTFGHFELGPFTSGGGTQGALLTAGGTVTIAGNFLVDVSARDISLNSNNTNATYDVAGEFELIAGDLNLESANGGSVLNVAGDFTLTAGTLTESSSGTVTVNFDGSSTQIFTSAITPTNILFDVNNGAILEVATDVTVISGGGFTLSNGGTLRIKSPAGITSAGATGNVQTTARTFNTGGIYEYVGSAAQVTGSGMPATVRGLRVNNGAGLTISNPVTLTPSVATTNPLTLSNGDITGALITVGSAYTGSGGGGSASSHVNAAMAKTGSTLYEFPIGNGTLYRPIEISSLSGSATVTAQYFQANPKTTFNDVMGSGVNHISACEYWDLNDGAATITGNVQLTFGGTSCNGGAYVNDPASLLVAHFSSGAWQNQGNDGAATTTTVQGNIPSTFSPFTVGSSTAMNPLPVKFGGIKAFENGTGVQIDWATHSESGLSHYVIERSSNGSSFTSIGTVLANNLVSESKYSFMDPSPLVVGFYRISSINYDGKRASSSIVKVSLDKSNVTVSLYPNPVTNGNISFQTSNLAKGVYTIRIFSATGQQVINQRMSHSGGAINQTIQLPSAAGKGLYTLQVENETIKVISRPFLVQ